MPSGWRRKASKERLHTAFIALAVANIVTFDMTSGIEDMKIAGGKLTISVAPGSDLINISGYDSKERYTVAVYNLAGEKVMGIDSWKGTAVDVSALPKGVYVFKINNTTLKFRK